MPRRTTLCAPNQMPALKVVLLATLTAALSVMLAASPAAAKLPSFLFTLIVTDCKTGAPIPAGVAIFSIIGIPATAVAPLTNGQVGPVGLGDYNFKLALSSPGYREDDRVLHGTGNPSQAETIHLCMHPVARSPESLVTATYPVHITCDPVPDQVCTPAFTTTITTNDVAQVAFTSSPVNCSSIQVDLGVDGSIFQSPPLAPGQSTGVVDFSPVSRGDHTVTVQATGIRGGCNTGKLVSWNGTLTVTTATPFGPTVRSACKSGGWRFFTSPAFKNEGDCVSYASTAGRNPAG